METRKINEQLKILHVFENYPGGNTTNWLYSILINTPNVQQILAARKFTKHNFYDVKFKYIENPYEVLRNHYHNINKFSIHVFEKLLVLLILKLYETRSFEKQITKHLLKENIQIIHAHFAHIGCKYVNLIKRNNKLFVVSFYGFDYEYLPFTNPTYVEKYKYLFSKSDLILCEGVHGVNTLVKLGCPEAKIAIARLGVNLNEIRYSGKLKKQKELKLIQIASLREKKGHIYTMLAFLKSKKECSRINLTIVGSGEEKIKEMIFKIIEENNLSECVQYIPEIDYSKIHEYLSNFDVFIHPSCYSIDQDCEGGAPVVLLDAQAVGLPVISTKHCDIPDEVLHLQTGYICEEKNIDEISNAINFFYQMDETNFEKYKVRSRKHIEENYSIKKNGMKIYELYEKLVLENDKENLEHV